MEALAEATADNFLDLTPNYDVSKQTFLLSNSITDSRSNTNVRFVADKEIPAGHPPNVTGGGSHMLDPDGFKCLALKDTFTGLIDGITGELVQGTREYVLTGEIYEGPFQNGVRHGDGAIVKNVYLPQKFSSMPKVCGKGAKFYGSYHEDSPSHGTLVVPSLFTYQGPLIDCRPHGENGALAKPSGYKYEGGFRDGLFHGFGIEREARGGMYKGEFVAGVRQGFGEYKIELGTANGKKIESDVSCVTGLYQYKGQWMGNQKQGEGEETLVRREIYRGQFHANERHGYGSLTFESILQSDDTDQDKDECIEDDIDGENSSDTNSEEGRIDGTGIIRRDRNLCQHISPVVAEGIWRAGYPLDGTHGWTLMYDNGDCYSGYATNFAPHGYGVMRYANKDIYTGQWKNGERCGEGCFISSDGKEEYAGDWDNDKIVPFNEGDKREKIGRLTDMAFALLRNEDESETDNFLEHIDDTVLYQRQRELLESIVKNSLSKSIERMRQCKGFENDNWPATPPKTGNADKKEAPRKNYIQSRRKIVKKVENKSSVRMKSSKASSVRETPEERPPDNGDSETSPKPFRTELKTYDNGDTYLGNHCPETGLRQGYGVYVSVANGSTYSGHFEHNVKQGYGILLHPLGKYSGNFVDDMKEGHGTFILNDASSYCGAFEKNEFHGKGTLCTKNNTIYTGDWIRGLKHGQGCETYSDGRVYIGNFQEGHRSGIGTLYEKSGGGIIYNGSWLNGLYHGEGQCIQRQSLLMHNSQIHDEGSSLQYEGGFFNGLRHGFGTLKNENNEVLCKGHFFQDEPISGKWRINFPSGSIYSGDVKVIKKHVDRNSSKSEIQICENSALNFKAASSTGFPESDIPAMPSSFSIDLPKPNGFGAMRYCDGDVYIGQFKDGYRHGHGSLFQDGEKIEGTWEKDLLVNDGLRITASVLVEYDSVEANF